MVTHESFVSKVIKYKDVEFSRPYVFVSFMDNSAVGVMTLKYIIENLDLHEFARISSPYVPPVTVFAAGKLRHPFRLYSNVSGTVVCILSDIPVDPDGYYEVTSTLLDWITSVNPKVVVNLDGVSSKEIPEGQRTFAVGDKENLSLLAKKKIPLAGSALITGLGGSIISESIIRQVPVMSFLTVTLEDVPDPDAVISIIETLNSIFGLDIKKEPLIEAAKKYHEELTKIMDEYNKVKSSSGKTPESMYG